MEHGESDSTALLEQSRTRAKDLLDQVVTPDQGIYASLDLGGEGPYHAFFTRDGAKTALFLIEAVKYGGDRNLAKMALDAMKYMARWQGKKNDPRTGEEIGKMPHEVRHELDGEMSAQQHGPGTNEGPWFVDPKDGVMKNWDTSDGTALWVSAILRGHEVLGEEIDDETDAHLRLALGWIGTNMAAHGGLNGYTGSSQEVDRYYSGIENKDWMDTPEVLRDVNGTAATYPVKSLHANAVSWAALQESALYYRESDADFAAVMQSQADFMKERFNDSETGFVVDEPGTVLAHAISGDGRRLTQSSVNQGSVLWSRTSDGRMVVDEPTAEGVADVMMSDAMFDPRAGIRNFAKGTDFGPESTEYHGSDRTYWPFIIGEVAMGLANMGRKDDAEAVMMANLTAIEDIGRNIEMFRQDRETGEIQKWSHPNDKIIQSSSLEQSWTAAAVYYMTNYLLSQSKEEKELV